MPAFDDVTPLEYGVLRSVVDLYTKSGRPVSSKMLKKRYRLRSSSANIRSVMHRLEAKGYLFKPHVSSGRVPSDLGYRLYVDGIGRIGHPGRRVIEQIRARIGRDRGDIREVMVNTSKLLSELTSCVGLMVGVFGPGGSVERIEMVQRDGGRALVVLRTEDGRERVAEVELEKNYDQHLVHRAVQIINERISGCTLDEAEIRLAGCERELAGVEKKIAHIVSGESWCLFSGDYDIEYYFRRLDFEEDMPEMRDPRILRSLVTLMGEKGLMLRALRKRIGRGVMVTIGEENELDELKRFSVITRAIPAGRCEGLVGVLGPTRMGYKSVLSLLEGMARELYDGR